MFHVINFVESGLADWFGDGDVVVLDSGNCFDVVFETWLFGVVCYSY